MTTLPVWPDDSGDWPTLAEAEVTLRHEGRGVPAVSRRLRRETLKKAAQQRAFRETVVGWAVILLTGGALIAGAAAITHHLPKDEPLELRPRVPGDGDPSGPNSTSRAWLGSTEWTEP